MTRPTTVTLWQKVQFTYFLCWKHRGLDPALIIELEEQVMRLSALTEQLLLEEFGVQKRKNLRYPRWPSKSPTDVCFSEVTVGWRFVGWGFWIPLMRVALHAHFSSYFCTRSAVRVFALWGETLYVLEVDIESHQHTFFSVSSITFLLIDWLFTKLHSGSCNLMFKMNVIRHKSPSQAQRLSEGAPDTTGTPSSRYGHLANRR